MRKRDVLSALGVELGAVVLYGAVLWGLTHPEATKLIAPRILRAVAAGSQRIAYGFGLLSIEAEKAAARAMEAAKL